jgi:hypothetical protein
MESTRHPFDGQTGRQQHDFGPLSPAAQFVSYVVVSEQNIAVLAYGSTATSSIQSISLSNSPWIDITNLFAPSSWNAVDTNADGSVILLTRSAAAGAQRFLSFEDGFLVDISTFIESQLSIAPNIGYALTDLADFQRVSVGIATLVVSPGVNEVRTSRFDHRTQIVTLDPLPLGFGGPTGTPLSVAEGPFVSGDGLTSVTSIVDPSGIRVLRVFQNGVSTIAALTPTPLPGAQSVQLARGVNETGNSVGGLAVVPLPGGGTVAEAAIWTPSVGWSSLRQRLAAVGVQTSPLDTFSSITDMSSRNQRMIGHGSDSTGTAVSFLARVPLTRQRADFNRDGIFPDMQDFADFAAAFALGNFSADWNYDGILDNADLVAFSNETD